MVILIIVILILLNPELAFAAPEFINYKTVGVVLAQDPNNMNVPSIELYRQVNDAIGKSETWVVAPAWSVKLNIKNQKTKGQQVDLGAIPAFDRNELISAHPNASKLLPEDKVTNTESNVIETIQIMLDTLALQGAIIVDCNPKGVHVVKSCGLYYYDRAKGKVVASTRKFFRAGVTDASKWSNHLTLALDKGLKNVKELKIKHELANVLTFTENDNDVSNTSLEFQFYGVSPSTYNIDGTAAGAAINLYKEDSNYNYGLGFNYTRSTKADLKYQAFGISMSFIPKALAAKSLVWELPIGIGIDQRRLSDKGPNALNLQQLDGKIFIGPSLLWQLTEKSSFGIGITYEQYLNINQKGDTNSDLEMFESGLKGLFLVKKAF